MRTLSISCGCWWGYIIRETTSDVPRSQFVLRWRNKTHKQDFRRAFRGQPTNSGPATCWPYQNQGMLLLMNLMESSCKSKKKCHHPQLCARKNRISISPASLQKKNVLHFKAQVAMFQARPSWSPRSVARASGIRVGAVGLEGTIQQLGWKHSKTSIITCITISSCLLRWSCCLS